MSIMTRMPRLNRLTMMTIPEIITSMTRWARPTRMIGWSLPALVSLVYPALLVIIAILLTIE